MLKGIMGAFSPRDKGAGSGSSKSQMFVSLSVTSTMRTAGLSRQATREIIRLSIGSLLFLGLMFIVIYTILLVYVDKKFRMSPGDDSYNYKRIKLLGKRVEPFRGGESFVFEYQIRDRRERKVAWNSSMLFTGETHPRCERRSVFRIIIASSPANRIRRQEIRKTWCKPENFLKESFSWQCVFLVSDSGSDGLNSMIREESDAYNDILIGTFTDSYRNLTFKVVHGINWVVNHCPSSYVVKTDDDCFVNAGVVLDFLQKRGDNMTSLYAGSFVLEKDRLTVIRGSTKWAVPRRDFPDDHYPPYASGIGYILSSDSAQRFIKEMNFIKPIVNEDAYVGIVMSHLGVKPTVSSRFLLSPSGLNVCNFVFVMITHAVEAQKQNELMRTSLKSKTLCKDTGLDSWS